MKNFLPSICLYVLLGAGSLCAQLPVASGHSVFLDVQNKGSGGDVAGSLGGGVGAGGGGVTTAPVGTTYSTDTESHGHSTKLAISIRNQDKTPIQVQVEWYFFAKQIQNNKVGKESVFDSGNKTITLQPAGNESFDITSKVTQTTTSRRYATATSYDVTSGNNTTSTYSIGDDKRNGTKLTGWVVRILVDGKILDAKGSEFKFEDAAKSPDKFEQLKAGTYTE